MDAASVQEYAKQVKQALSVYYAGSPIKAMYKLGDFGLLQGSVFIYLGNLKDAFQITFDVRPDGGESAVNFASQSGVSVAFHAKGQAAQVNASVEVKFSEQNAVLFNLAGCTAQAVEDQVRLGTDVLKLYNNNQWNEQFAVVTTLISAKSTTILMSSSESSSISLQASSPDVASINLSDASLQLSISAYTDMALSITTQGGLTPLVGLSKVHDFILRDPSFGPEQVLEILPADAHRIKVPGPFFGSIK